MESIFGAGYRYYGKVAFFNDLLS